MRETALTRDAGIAVPLICGAMFPCSNLELVAAVSEAGAIGIIQPITLVYVHRLDYREALRALRERTARPVGMNVILETSSRLYLQRMRQWVEQSLEGGVRFFVTSLGDPRWVCDLVHPHGGVVYHDVTEERFARKAIDGGADGLIAVNARAGGHAGRLDAATLFDRLAPLGRPLVAAGGVGDEREFARLLLMGYDGVQAGTRFIATTECAAPDAYKRAIVEAGADDIVLTERVTGVPLAVINTPWVQQVGTRAGPVARALLRGRRTKHLMRAAYALRSAVQLKRASLGSGSSRDYWQAGKSVDGIAAIEPAGAIVRRFAAAWAGERGTAA
jgi:nitronate monooxygenase